MYVDDDCLSIIKVQFFNVKMQSSHAKNANTTASELTAIAATSVTVFCCFVFKG